MHCKANKRLISDVFQWSNTIDHDGMRRKLAVCRMNDLCSSYSNVDDVYKKWKGDLHRSLSKVPKYRRSSVGNVIL